MKVTIFTPTYNRAYIIRQLYQSLQRQTCSCFEWLVVDDGSSDNTESLISSWIKEDNAFLIRYYRKENGGKHRAINYAVPLAAGELFFIVDSDDYLADNAIELILQQVQSLPSNGACRFSGICNCRGYSLSQIMGTTFFGEYIDCTTLERDKYGITGDKAEVFFTEVVKKYPFPEFSGETFITEAVVWDRMAADGWNMRFFQNITYLCEYRQDGLTQQGLDLYYRNPQGYALYLRQCRAYHKFPYTVQNYFEVQCYFAWRKTMTCSGAARLLNVNPVALVLRASKYALRQKAAAIIRKMKGAS